MGTMPNLIRHVFALLVALPLVVGLIGSSFAAPCAHAQDGGADQCPCCDKTILAGPLSCGLACHAGIEMESRTSLRLPEELRVSFAPLHERAEGIEIEPLLPPPR
jgi:hypothetical protein